MLQHRMLLKYLLRMSDLEMTYVYLYQGMHVCNQPNINVNSVVVHSKVQVLSLPGTRREKSTFRLFVGVVEAWEKPRVFLYELIRKYHVKK